MLPLHFKPLIKRIRWGGTRLGTILSKPIGEAADAAESWEVVDHGIDQSVVTSEEFAGRTLRQLVADHSQELFGAKSFSQFPLLLKFLDATDRLSLQVHPDDAQAKKYIADENGKTEAWVILDAAPGSRLWLGLKAGVSRGDLEAALVSGDLDEVVHTCEPKPGDCYFVQAGTVHAIGEGILLAEVQQSSDITFRLHDWGRVGVDGQPRPVHIEESLDCTDYERGPVRAVTPVAMKAGEHAVERLIASEWFGIERHISKAPVTLEPRDEFRILMLIGGELMYDCGERSRTMVKGETVLIPASCSAIEVTPLGTATWLQVTGPSTRSGAAE